jgi:hypothetical protein
VQSFADLAGYNAAFSALSLAITAVTNGQLQQRVDSLTTRYNNAPSSDPSSAREEKWLVRMEDAVTLKRYSFAIPCRDDSAVVYQQNSDFVDLAGNTATTDLVTAIEAIYATPVGNAGTVVSIERVGRNN